MTTNETHNMAIKGLECLRNAVREELQKKALLGEFVIISRDGKTCCVPASEALKIAEGKCA
jgi:hypothetical protein